MMNEHNQRHMVAGVQGYQERDTLRILEEHTHYARINRIKMLEQFLSAEDRAKYEKRYRAHLTAIARLALELSLEGQANDLSAQ